ncbi:uncharacterized protein LOC123560417 isoform X2 [Mercenaria mercenaria]|uniref:uncharacterized protein LOC123560417 isoform X2 n=2 Tax=Mercenaria mercenaria TaxID=6596 RepID=UPI00234F6ADE|nr:uncharacterized protein LOC123560417 isoform X2 [Mercenaria mercenaria]
MLFSLIISTLLCGSIVPARGCKDIDTAACIQMSKQRPDLCSDQTIAKNACPAFCKLCPPVCYHCNTTVQDYHLCTNTMTCPNGSVCMRKELKSIYDGHHEYELTCAQKQECDNPWNGSGPFGKRDIMSRDLSVTCCIEDLCNYHMPSLTTPKSNCVKDLILVVDETDRIQPYENTLISFLNNVVSSLPVNEAEIHVALGLFSNSFRPIFDLNELHSKSETLNALNSQTLSGADRGDTQEALNYILEHALTPASGDRPAV